jgi:signal transduction histidine kinase
VRAAAPVRVPCDARKVKQIVINLMQNAIEASARGGEITIEVADGPGGARVSLLDRGGGLAETIAAHAFEAGATTKPKGSGLGLTIARALARQHGGELTLSARPGGGCIAELTLPRSAA